MTTTAVVHPYAGSTPAGLVYRDPVQIECTVREGGQVETDAAAVGVCPLWSVLVVPGRYRNSRPRKVRAVAIQHEGDRVVIETEALIG